MLSRIRAGLMPRSSRTRYLHRLATVLFTVATGATGCVGAPASFSILHRQPLASTFSESGRGRIAIDYDKERAYVTARRSSGGVPPGNPDEDLVGLALSGGGIRSATFGLGVLQALHARSIVERLDYTSATSGGAYILGWLEAHYGVALRPGEHDRDRLGYTRLAADAADILGEPAGVPNDHLIRLRSRAGFLNRGGLWPGAEMIWAYAWRLLPAFVIDVALHLKGKTNWQHIVDVYRQRIGETYLLGREELTVAELDTNAHKSPYAVITANLVNSDFTEHAPFRDDFYGNGFEFTRDFIGSDALGYVPPEAFDRPVIDVTWTRDAERGEFLATAVTVHGPVGPKRAIPIATSIAAAGAAFDPDGVFGRSNLFTRALGGSVGAALNLSVGYETWNYARTLNGWWTLFDYARMFTYQRVTPFVPRGARWIKITDGGHYDNTSVFALLRRGVRTIVAAEAVADGGHKFEDRDRLKQLAEDVLGVDPCSPEDWHGNAVTLTRDGRTLATIHFVKPPKAVCNGALDATDADEAKICGYANDNPTYPHTTTLRQWYYFETFEAYRLLGRKMANDRFTSFERLVADAPAPCREKWMPGTAERRERLLSNRSRAAASH